MRCAVRRHGGQPTDARRSEPRDRFALVHVAILRCVTDRVTTLRDDARPPFQSLDFVYVPSRDVRADLDDFTNTLGGKVAFAIESNGTRVAAVELTEGPPLVLLTDHLEGERPILIYRVDNLDETLAILERRGWDREHVLEIPHGPCCSIRTPGGHRIAVYQLTRPEVAAHFSGRVDF
jgi:hypothetical protein